MKQLLQTILLLAFSPVFLHSQVTFTATPNPFTDEFEVDLTDFYVEPVAHTVVAHNSSGTVELRWEINVVSAPSEWAFKVCDNNACYSTSVTTNINPPMIDEPVVLTSGATTLLDLHILPRYVPGTGVIEINLSLASDPGTILETVAYNITVTGSTVNVSEASKRALRLYPNPTSDFIVLTDNEMLVDRIEVYNIVGRQVRSFRASQGARYNLADLPDGMYLVSLISQETGILKTMRISKRSVNP
jgi:hypothetical protein